MPTILSFGDIDLDVMDLTGFEELAEAIFSEQPVIGDKATLQHTGDGLKAIEIRLTLHQSFTDVQAMADALDVVQAAAEARPLAWADGTDMGQYVLLRVQKIRKLTTPEGVPLVMDVALSFKEWAGDGDQATTRSARANSNTVLGFSNTAASDTSQTGPIRTQVTG